MKIALHRRPANPRSTAAHAAVATHLTGRDREVDIDFTAIRCQPDPEWARPTSARLQRWAQGQADAAYAEIGPYGPVIIASAAVSRVVSQANSVMDEIERTLALLTIQVDLVRRGVV